MSQFFNRCFNLTPAVGAVLIYFGLHTGTAQATNVIYDIDESFSMVFTDTIGDRDFAVSFGTDAAHQAHFTFSLNTDRGTADLTATLVGIITDPASGDALTDSPVSAELKMHYTGLEVGRDPVTGKEVIAIGRPRTNGNGHLKFSSDYFGTRDPFQFHLRDEFGFPDGGVSDDPVYGDLGLDPFNLFFGSLDGSADPFFNAWLKGPNRLHVLGSIYEGHGSFGAASRNCPGREVPEPSTIILLSAASLGGLLKRRRLLNI